MVIWPAWTIVVGAISVLEVGALSYNKDVASNELSGSFMKPTMLRDKRDLASQSRIVGGNDADIGKYPFFVEWDLCGASLIHKGKQHRNPSCQPCVACACSQLTLSFSTHTQTSFYQQLIVMKSRQTQCTSDLHVDLPLMKLEVVANRDLLPNASPIPRIMPSQLILTISS